MDVRPCYVPQGPRALRALLFGRARGPARTAFICVRPKKKRLMKFQYFNR